MCEAGMGIQVVKKIRLVGEVLPGTHAGMWAVWLT